MAIITTPVSTDEDAYIDALNSLSEDDGLVVDEKTLLYSGCRTLDYTLGSGDSTEMLSLIGFRCVIAVATGSAKWMVANSAGTLVREFSGIGLAQNATASLAGIIVGVNMPQRVRLTDTSGGSNPVTIYLVK